jgi:hypothetical protein
MKCVLLRFPKENMIDFSKLRPDPSSHKGPFEGLICGIARRFRPTDSSAFNWIAGAGGDGGVEAYWTTFSGDEIGYQAKYHLRSGDIDWGKIDASVSAALRSHPKLVHYVVAIACDLTDTVPARGKSGRDHRNEHKVVWEALAEKHGMVVNFEFWGASEIEDRLTQSCCEGLRSYWLGELELGQLWFRSTFDRTAVLLDERYQPQDHVEVGAERAFGGLLRDQRFRKGLSSALDSLPTGATDVSNALGQEAQTTIQEVCKAVASISRANDVIPDDPTHPMCLSALRDRIAAIKKTARWTCPGSVLVRCSC